jgi:hypothetical protein
MGNKNKSSSSVASNLNILKTTHTFIHLQTHCNYSTKKGSSLTRSQQHSFIQPHSPQQKKFTNLIATSKQRSVQTKQNKTKQTPQHNTTRNKTKQNKLSSATTKISVSGFKGLWLELGGVPGLVVG